MENINDLYLESSVFDDARTKFNVVLQRLFRSMVDTNSDEASISLKMDVKMKRSVIANNDPNIEGETREIMLPEFAYKVSSSIQVKCETKGNNDPQMELVWDDEQKKYVLQYIANTSQRSIFDSDFQENMRGSGESSGEDAGENQIGTNAGTAQIAGPVADEGALPGDIQEGDPEEGRTVIDGEYREVNTGSGDNDECPGDDQEDDLDGDGYGYEEPGL